MNVLNHLQLRLISIAYKHKIGHLGSSLSTLPVVYGIYLHRKKENDIFVLSNGHAAQALYVTLEHFYPEIDAEKLLLQHGVHPEYDPEHKIYCSAGSLGQGLSVAIGYALSDPKRDVYVTISDGECAEGVVWESLRFIHERNITNIHVHLISNGLCATSTVNSEYLEKCLSTVYPGLHIIKSGSDFPPVLNGVEAHYKVLSESDYETLKKVLEHAHNV